MSQPQSPRRFLGPVLLGLLVVASLFLVTLVYRAGEPFLGSTILVITALAAWLYTSKRAYAYRYLFPAIAAALIFVVFPIFYMMGIGFTNYSSANLLEFPQATRYLLEETAPGEGGAFNFSLHPDGERFRARLEDQEKGTVFISEAFGLDHAPGAVATRPEAEAGFQPGEAVDLATVIDKEDVLKQLTLVLPDKTRLGMTGLSDFGSLRPVYRQGPQGTLVSNLDGTVLTPNFRTGFYETAGGEQVQPGFKARVGLDNYKTIFTEPKWRDPFLRIFIWTVVFSLLTVFFTASLGMVLAVLLNWEQLRFRSVYRLLLFLPYAIPAFISILVWKGLFNNNFGEINMILQGLFGVHPSWFSDPFLAKVVILIVNTWLGFPYMMVVCMGLIKAIPTDLYEASAVAGAGPLTNFFKITVPLIKRPLMPLLISSFAFNFNNFVLIALLTGGRPDFADAGVPAGTTDVLITYVYRNAFQDSGQRFGLAAALSTVIFVLIAVITIVQMRTTKIAQEEKR